MTATQQTESAERIARPLIQLAKLNGISTSYIDQLGTYVEIRDEVLVSVLAALGVDASSDEAIAASYELTKQRIADTLVEPTIVKFIGKEATTPIRAKGHDVTLRLLLEDGTRYEGNLCMYLAPQTDGSLTLTLPDDIPAGYHTLRVNAGPLHGEARLICAPARVPLPPAVAEKQRWGWMAQMYSIRSAESWGVGDYGDLKLLLTDAAEKSHADFMLINPIHATAPVEPLEPSPYLPESRRFMNVTYIRPQDIEEYAGLDEAALAEVERLHAEVAPANDNADELDINSAWWHKRQALQLVFKVPRSAERQAAFEAFKEAAGPDLRAFAAWSVAFQMWGAPWEGTWFAETNRNSPEVAELMRDHADMVEFECWLQWIADEHWSEDDPNPKALYPRLSPLWNNNNTKASTLYVRNGKMLRLKTAEIGYTYKKMRVYVSGTNLLTFAPFKYWDPEKGSGNGLGYPLQRTYNLGFQFNF